MREREMREAKEVYVDGAARGNPGPAGLGVVFKATGGEPVLTVARYLGETTNNVAEYKALIVALKAAIARGWINLRIFSDSQLMCRQIKGLYKVKAPHLKGLFEEAMGLLGKLCTYDIIHVERERNKEADRLANEAIDKALGRRMKRRLPRG